MNTVNSITPDKDKVVPVEARRELYLGLQARRLGLVEKAVSITERHPSVFTKSTYLELDSNAEEIVDQEYYYTPLTTDGRTAVVLPGVGVFILQMDTELYGHVPDLDAPRLVEYSNLLSLLRFNTLDLVLRGENPDEVATNGLPTGTILKVQFGTQFDNESHSVVCFLDCTSDDDLLEFESFVNQNFV